MERDPVSNCPQCELEVREIIRTMERASRTPVCPSCKIPLTDVAGKYRLVRQIGGGGFGVLYLAEHVKLRHTARRVVKFLRPEAFETPDARERFEREIQLTCELSEANEHIVRTYDDFGWLADVGPYYVMEFLDGQTLTGLLADAGGSLEVGPAMHIFTQICRAVEAAHQRQVVHRDLKPDNVMLVRRREDERFVKVLDFGISKPLDDPASLTQGIIGSPYYLSPEQCHNGAIDERSDVYSLGVVLFEMLAGRPPFAPESGQVEGPAGMYAIFQAHVSQEPPRVNDLRDRRPVPDSVEEAVLRAMSKKAEDRFSTIGQLLDALPGDDGLEEIARPESPPDGSSTSPDTTDRDASPRLPQTADVHFSLATGSTAEPVPRRRRSLGLFALVGVVALLVVGLAVWRLVGDGPDRSTPDGSISVHTKVPGPTALPRDSDSRVVDGKPDGSGRRGSFPGKPSSRTPLPDQVPRPPSSVSGSNPRTGVRRSNVRRRRRVARRDRTRSGRKAKARNHRRTPTSPKPVAGAGSPAGPAVARRTRSVALRTKPAEVVVFLPGGKQLCTTPCSQEFLDGATVVLILRKPGYRDKRVVFRASDRPPDAWSLELERL